MGDVRYSFFTAADSLLECYYTTAGLRRVEIRDEKVETMSERMCWRCGKELPPGGLNYVIHIEVFAGFDGLLLEPEEGVDKELRRLTDQIEKSDPKNLEKEVYEEFTLVLCKSCRDRFVDEMQHPWEGPFQIPKDPDRTIH